MLLILGGPAANVRWKLLAAVRPFATRCFAFAAVALVLVASAVATALRQRYAKARTRFPLLSLPQ
ncbi:hypothetical protein CHX27_10235 [Flavobacterium aurantiibacter]|uniref:Uncharacterized protein n=1 Tax=Flavobacterium aurantiibacter TaxID=2023067 RepID=A0A255ZPR1_9FLAO|nr:hypothetical protein CHX27_10235 [Flavobacterium aurantiibacter]